jgi:hypothetical protein
VVLSAGISKWTNTKFISAWGTAGRYLEVDGSGMFSSAFDGKFDSSGSMTIGYEPSADRNINAYLRNLKVYRNIGSFNI